MKIEKAGKIIFFGGGDLLVDLARISLKKKLQVFCFAVKRHLNEILLSNGGLRLAEVLKKEKIPFFEVSEINRSADLKRLVTGDAIGLGLGEAYTFSQETVSLFKGRLFDFMVIDLPRYRGGAHFTWQILSEDRVGCWNIQVINKDMVPGVFDSGEILMRRKYLIPAGVNNPQGYFDAAQKEGVKLFMDFIKQVGSGAKFKLTRPNEDQSLYLPRLNTLVQAFINWSWDAQEIKRFISAFDHPYKGASTFINQKRVFLKKASLSLKEGGFHPFMAGLVIRIRGNSVFIAANGGTLAVKEIIDENGRPLLSSLKVGQRLYTPVKYLESALLFNSEYDANGPVRRKRS